MVSACIVSFTNSSKSVAVTDEVDLQKKKAELGKRLFFEESLSNPVGKSCASCHAPESGFADPNGKAVSEGVFSLNGSRNSPTIAYAAFSPEFGYDAEEEVYFGGQFWDGRASNLNEQAQGPLLNHVEMNNANKKMVIETIKKSNCASLFKEIYGETIFENTDKAFGCVTEALEAYENTLEVNPFSSKFDLYLEGKAKLSAQEKYGLKVFNDPKKGNCAACHTSTEDEITQRVLFTDFTYDNLGVPKNTTIGSNAIDYGLGKILGEKSENGKFKVPTLRNVANTAPYFHNGIFSSLEEVVDFYSERDSGKFGPAEVSENVNHEELGNLKLNKSEKAALVSFMKTLSDGYINEKSNARK